ncbi:hypothetical protein PF002_g15800 [Phytophthora fragariae]|uniref:Uncharacterized protein n=2 Tax=Phytophthora TaxID=4783 RepID=A0A6A3YKX0_9STRA|nr:hypothetical protein PR002_g5501 [Phytophthora rubi]KAE9135995.1 hypothetical protein PF006_g14489 [Phytophthora fragariae]KAE9216649.1 hypothetical protein PF004_g14400 [Phytophthora fragariae]KAE9220746.1 hypothetical protein PF002_g15800 [Phytophthora fragariae]KAE9300741.1 hypothetical protein PF001_g14797 [Phytophthora fragariae]
MRRRKKKLFGGALLAACELCAHIEMPNGQEDL